MIGVSRLNTESRETGTGTYPGFFPYTAYFWGRGLPVKMGPPLTKGASTGYGP